MCMHVYAYVCVRVSMKILLTIPINDLSDN